MGYSRPSMDLSATRVLICMWGFGVLDRIRSCIPNEPGKVVICKTEGVLGILLQHDISDLIDKEC